MKDLHESFRLEYRGRCYSSSRLQTEINTLCHYLQQQGLEPGMVLASVVEQRWLNVLLLFALPRMGCIFFPLDPALPVQLRQRLLGAAKVDVLLEEPLELQAQRQTDRVFEQVLLKSEDVCLLIATSGTNGFPRIVELTGSNLHSSALAAEQCLQISSSSVWLACLPLFHIGGLSVLLRGVFSGAKVVLEDKFEPQRLAQLLAEKGVSHLSMVPTMLARLLAHNPDLEPQSALKVVLLGGGPATAGLVNAGLQRGWPLCPSYGMTETASQVATCYPPPGRWQAGSVGKALPHVEIAVGSGGEIRVRGASVAKYVRLIDGSREELLDAQGWLCTQDAGWLDEARGLHILGRLDDMLITGGENIHPHMLEQELAVCPGVEEVAVVAIEDPVWGEKLIALYVGSCSAQELKTWAKQRLKKAFLPKVFFAVESLPRNAMGKLLRAEAKHFAAELSQLE